MLLYSAQQSQQIDHQAIANGASGFALMQQAASFAVDCLLERWGRTRRVAIIAGKGNNAGDGLVMAVLLRQQGVAVDVFLLNDATLFAHEAAEAYQLLQAEGIVTAPFSPTLNCDYDVVVDAMLGIGQKSPLSKEILAAIKWINKAKANCLALDMPTGIACDTGLVLEKAVKAALTVTFITRKLGQFIGEGPDYCGELCFSDLQLDAKALLGKAGEGEKAVRLLDFERLKKLLKPRDTASHKGDFGHVLVIGGDEGFGGAAILAAVAAIRLGAGKVTLATMACHVMPALNCQPEIMVKSVLEAAELEPLMKEASVIVVGPGLGQSDWGQSLLQAALASALPKVIDADALNLIANYSEKPDLSQAVLTPHPGEAARLLDSDSAVIQENRLAAVVNLQRQYQTTVLLKGAGSLVANNEELAVCPYGNAHMASGGMGDVLSGMIGAFIAQGLSLMDALELAVVLHAKAGDVFAKEEGGLGLVASDILTFARRLMNDKV